MPINISVASAKLYAASSQYKIIIVISVCFISSFSLLLFLLPLPHSYTMKITYSRMNSKPIHWRLSSSLLHIWAYRLSLNFWMACTALQLMKKPCLGQRYIITSRCTRCCIDSIFSLSHTHVSCKQAPAYSLCEVFLSSFVPLIQQIETWMTEVRLWYIFIPKFSQCAPFSFDIHDS